MKKKVSLDLKPKPSLTSYYFITRGLLIILIISLIFFSTSPFIFFLFLTQSNPFSIYNSMLATTIWILAGIFFSIFFSIFYCNSLRKSFRLKIVGDYLYYKGGVFFKKEVLIPLENLKSVEASQNFLEKFFNIFSLKIYSQAFALKFPGVEKGFELASFILDLSS